MVKDLDIRICDIQVVEAVKEAVHGETVIKKTRAAVEGSKVEKKTEKDKGKGTNTS